MKFDKGGVDSSTCSIFSLFDQYKGSNNNRDRKQRQAFVLLWMIEASIYIYIIGDLKGVGGKYLTHAISNQSLHPLFDAWWGC